MLPAAHYRFDYNVPVGFDTVDFVIRMRALLSAIDVEGNIQVTDQGGFHRIRVTVPEGLAAVASFRLMPLNGRLASQGRVGGVTAPARLPVAGGRI